MATSFPLDVETFNVPFKVIPNVAFPDTTPVCVLTNLGPAAVSDTFIVTYPGFGPPPPPIPFEPDPWQIEFRWETTSPPRAGFWLLDAWLESLTEGPNLHVPAAPALPLVVPGGSPQAYDVIIGVGPSAVSPPLPPPPLEIATARLYRLITSIRWAETPTKLTRVVGRGIGPIIEFFIPLP
jgi:hypothetical protein